MGTAGLDIAALRKHLHRQHIDSDLVQGDSLGDFCILRLTDARYPHREALLRYENQGIEPRIVWLLFTAQQTATGLNPEPPGEILATRDNPESFDESEMLRLNGRRKDDPEKIADWLAQMFRKAVTD